MIRLIKLAIQFIVVMPLVIIHSCLGLIVIGIETFIMGVDYNSLCKVESVKDWWNILLGRES